MERKSERLTGRFLSLVIEIDWNPVPLNRLYLRPLYK